MDGTFHQERPLDLLHGLDKLFSFDLKSATNQWPFFFMFELMVVLFDRRFASTCVNLALGYNIFV
ncbi:hypothetical protein IEQ34_021080 [Dendrobium chrysotoxum]|uniref:Uncharacterized protein n=1 Tax=Dendrobium chrysotoxum TaxID=161865 RepID=A0AAV7G3W9_DENCH|nr:hypothetical protein IEQ34_021080 [Dendrobium chrysotoxum]